MTQLDDAIKEQGGIKTEMDVVDVAVNVLFGFKPQDSEDDKKEEFDRIDAIQERHLEFPGKSNRHNKRGGRNG